MDLAHAPALIKMPSKESSIEFANPDSDQEMEDVAHTQFPKYKDDAHLLRAPITFVSISAPDLAHRDSLDLPASRSVELPEFYLFGYDPTERSVFSPASPDPSLHYVEDIERIIEERRLGDRRSAEAIHNQIRHKPTVHKPAYSVFPITYYYHLDPTHDMNSADELADRREAFNRFERDLNGHMAAAATLRTPAEDTNFPDFVWRSHTEDGVFEIRSPPSRRLQRGDVLHCYGGLRGYWRLGGPVKRYWKREDPREQQATEWVQVMCYNDREHQQAWVKIPAYFFCATSIPDRFGRFISRSLRSLRSVFHINKAPCEEHTDPRTSMYLQNATVEF
ncbi:hypothetical protein C8R45DRAFT_936137 [Mycena sanguinolenta]|nr:hypothetical protein C8R45DRAFT_936137 [Mycena sanguinolenta]